MDLIKVCRAVLSLFPIRLVMYVSAFKFQDIILS